MQYNNFTDCITNNRLQPSDWDNRPKKYCLNLVFYNEIMNCKKDLYMRFFGQKAHAWDAIYTIKMTEQLRSGNPHGMHVVLLYTL